MSLFGYFLKELVCSNKLMEYYLWNQFRKYLEYLMELSLTN